MADKKMSRETADGIVCHLRNQHESDRDFIYSLVRKDEPCKNCGSTERIMVCNGCYHKPENDPMQGFDEGLIEVPN